VFVAPGLQNEEDVHVQFVTDSFTRYPGRWRVCVFHYNMYLMTLGAYTDHSGWAIYETCRQMGAIIQTAHEHSYSRTFAMSSFSQQQVYSTQRDQVVLQEQTGAQPGLSFAFVSGVSGHSVRPIYAEKDKNAWWASALGPQSAPPLDIGALFCKFNFNGQMNQAYCYFKETEYGGKYNTGLIRDEFFIVTNLRGSPPAPQPRPSPSSYADDEAPPSSTNGYMALLITSVVFVSLTSLLCVATRQRHKRCCGRGSDNGYSLSLESP